MEHATNANETARFQKRNIFLFWDTLFFILKARVPSLVVRTINIAYKPFGYSGAGFGYYTNVLRKADEVTKVFEFSTKCTESERVALLRSLNERLEIAERYLGKYLVNTTTSIEAHPISGLRCVVIHQPYIEGKLLLNRPYAASLNANQLINYSKLLNNALRLHNDENYLLDLNKANLIIHDDTVLVLDTILAGTIDIVMFPMILKILNNELSYIKQLDSAKN
jgi:hypothetical protein